MTKAHKRSELPAAMDLAAEFAQKIVVERNHTRPRNRSFRPGKRRAAGRRCPAKSFRTANIYDYAAKYLEEGTRLEIPAKLSKAQVRKFQEYAVRAFRCLECRGMARVDFFLEKPQRAHLS